MNKDLEIYLQETILPKYKDYDKGHNTSHIEEVLSASIELAANYDVDIEMIYTAAIFHDLGIVEGRDTHHLSSARMLREDKFVTDYFSIEKINTIAEAIEDHRASAKSNPRSIYGEILSSADRVINVETIIVRSYYHSIKHFPNYTFEEHIERIVDHIVTKYGENGYLRIPILTQSNRENLERLYNMLKDINEFKRYCTNIIKLNI